MIKENLSDLWKYSFVHKWRKPENHTKEAAVEERLLFKKYHKADRKEEVEAGFFVETEEERAKRLKPFERNTQRYEPIKTIRKELPKIGRNEKVTVKYEDGSIKSGIKYKKVMREIESGKCKIIR